MTTFLTSAFARIKQLPVHSSGPYALGRFATVRKAYSAGVASAQHLGLVPRISQGDRTIFEGVTPEGLAAGLQRDAVGTGLHIPPAHLDEIAGFCRNAELLHWRTRRRFRLGDVVNGYFSDGMPAIIADVVDMDTSRAARHLAHDPTLLEAFRLYTGYTPMRVDIRTLVSFASPVSEATRVHYGQTVNFHFDVHSYNFVYANFYLTDVDENSGAHVMIDGSHRRKPAKWLFSSANKSDAEVQAEYGNARARLIEGQAGTGFIQDSSCYHKATAPIARDRIMLHLRYY